MKLGIIPDTRHEIINEASEIALKEKGVEDSENDGLSRRFRYKALASKP